MRKSLTVNGLSLTADKIIIMKYDLNYLQNDLHQFFIQTN